MGLYEIVTLPESRSYGPVWTNYLTPKPPYPDSYQPGLPDDSIFATDTSFGFSGGEIAPYIPGSRFRVFDNCHADTGDAFTQTRQPTLARFHFCHSAGFMVNNQADDDARKRFTLQSQPVAEHPRPATGRLS